MIELPSALEAFVESRLASADRRSVTAAATDLSERYRARLAPRVDTPEAALAYAAWILPATHAQVLGALRGVPLRVGEWRPRSLLDLGGGPGTAAWAALDVWPDLRSIRVVDREPTLLALGRDAAKASPFAALRDASWVRADLPSGTPSGSADLVIVAHVLNELADDVAGQLVRRAWEATAGVLVLVEPGTPPGFVAIETARRLGISLGGSVLGPCPHDAACPLAEAGRATPARDWCHFAERHGRPPFQRRIKDASLPWEDAKLSWVSLARFPSAAPPWARVLRHPWHRKGHVDLQLCAREGLVQRDVARSAADGWRLARELEWGSAVQRAEDLGPK